MRDIEAIVEVSGYQPYLICTAKGSLCDSRGTRNSSYLRLHCPVWLLLLNAPIATRQGMPWKGHGFRSSVDRRPCCHHARYSEHPDCQSVIVLRSALSSRFLSVSPIAEQSLTVTQAVTIQGDASCPAPPFQSLSPTRVHKNSHAITRNDNERVRE